LCRLRKEDVIHLGLQPRWTTSFEYITFIEQNVLRILAFFRSVLVRNSAISSSDNRERHFRKTLDKNDLNQVVASSGFSENKDLGEVLSLAGS